MKWNAHSIRKNGLNLYIDKQILSIALIISDRHFYINQNVFSLNSLFIDPRLIRMCASPSLHLQSQNITMSDRKPFSLLLSFLFSFFIFASFSFFLCFFTSFAAGFIWTYFFFGGGYGRSRFKVSKILLFILPWSIERPRWGTSVKVASLVDAYCRCEDSKKLGLSTWGVMLLL